MTLKVSPREELIVDKDEGQIYVRKGTVLLTYVYPYDYRYFRSIKNTGFKTLKDMLALHKVIGDIVADRPQDVSNQLALIFNEISIYLKQAKKDIDFILYGEQNHD